MLINADFAERVVVDTTAMEWAPSPGPGVDRKMLERIGGERARSTTIVRYAPGARFDEHTHPHGEEILVLDGVYGDDHDVYPKGAYLRLPWASKHAPFCPEGATLLVKNGQLPAGERRLVIRSHGGAFTSTEHRGIERCILFDSPRERVAVERMKRGTAVPEERVSGGLELFVLEGELEDGRGRYPQGTWLRLPVGAAWAPRCREGCLLWMKRGHLAAWTR